MWKVSDFIFLGSKVTADGDCSPEIKRSLLLGRKAITHLDNVLKSRDITLPANVCIVKAMVLPAVMWERERWTMKSVSRRIDTFKLWCWRRLLRVPWTPRGSNQSMLKKINPECSLEGLMLKLKLQYFGHMIGKDPDVGKDWGQEEKRIRWLDGITDSMDTSLSKLGR